MSLTEEVALLKAIPLFANIEPAKLKLLAFTSERLTFEKNDSLFRQGEAGDAAYIIMEGEADILINSPEGLIAVARVAKNALLGEISILCDVPRTATAVAATPLIALKISKDLFLRLLAEFPQMGVEIMRVLAQRLERTTIDLREANAKLKSVGIF